MFMCRVKSKGNEKRTFFEVNMESKNIINNRYKSFPGQGHILRNGGKRQSRKYNQKNMKATFFIFSAKI